jgi:uncharacterized protein (DUF924 family)
VCEQALGLHLLLDQAPPALFEGMYGRYTYAYFQLVSRKLAQQILDLPTGLRVASKKRRMEERGASFDFWVLAHLWFIAPWVRSEDLAGHEFAGRMNEAVRVEVEEFSGKTDPYRARRAELAEDTYAFGTMHREGPQVLLEKGREMEEFVFWLWTVLDVHKPIIVKFGRYLYQDVAKGRMPNDEDRE